MEPVRSVVSSNTRTAIYSVDTSNVVHKIKSFVDIEQDIIGRSSFKEAFNSFAQDIARCDVAYSWFSTMRIIVIGVYLILSSFGSLLITVEDIESSYQIIVSIVRYIITLIPYNDPNLDVKLMVTIYLQMEIIILSILLFFIFIVFQYKHENFPSDFVIKVWIFISHCILPFFSNYAGFLFAFGFVKIFLEQKTVIGIAALVLGVPMTVTQMAMIWVYSFTYTSTPIIRKYDFSQLWYCCIAFDWCLQLLIFLSSFLQTILAVVPLYWADIIFLVYHWLFSGFLLYQLFTHHVYVHPIVSSIVGALLEADIFFSIIPIVAYNTKNGFLYMLIICFVLFIAAIPLNGLLLSYLMKKIILKVCSHDSRDEFDAIDDRGFVNISSEHVAIDYDSLGFNSELELSIAIRVGFMYHIDETSDPDFLSWCFQSHFGKNLALSICQVSLQSCVDAKIMISVQKAATSRLHSVAGINNFLCVFNDLRLGALSQQNKPLISAISKVKKANNMLHRIMGEFWGSALKSRADIMWRMIPEISVEIKRCHSMFERNIRNYPRVSTVYHEMNLFYYLSMADFHKAVEFQAMFNIHRNRGQQTAIDDTAQMSTNHNSISFEDKNDQKYIDHMEPYIAAQDVIHSVPSFSTKAYTFLIILSFLVLIIIPTAITIDSLTIVTNFHQDFRPSTVIGSYVYNMGRLPQLFRRLNLYHVETILPYIPDTGPPLSALLEFVNRSLILPSIEKYVILNQDTATVFLQFCKNENSIKKYCEEKSIEAINGNSKQNVTIYDMVSFLNLASQALLTKGDWANFMTDKNAIFLFENFENFYFGMNRILTALEDDLLSKKGTFLEKSMIYMIVNWILPFIILFPILITAYVSMKNEIMTILKIFPSLPKSEISMLRYQKTTSKAKRGAISVAKDTDPGDAFNQSENTSLKDSNIDKLNETLSTIARKNSGIFASFITYYILIICLSLFMTFAICLYYQTTITNVMDLASSYFKIIRVSATATSSYIWFQELFTTKYMLNWTTVELKEKALFFVQRLLTNFDGFLFGSGNDFKPGLLISDDILKHFAASKPIEKVDLSILPVFSLLHSVYFHDSCDSQIRLYQDIARYLLNVTDTSVQFSFQDPFVYHFEHLIFAHLNRFFVEGKDLIVSKTQVSDNGEKFIIILIYVTNIVFFILSFSIIIIPKYHEVISQIKTVRSMLLLMPPDSLLNSQSVMRWISGKTCQRQKNDANSLLNRKVQLDYIIEESKCGLIITDKDLRIIMNNKMALTLLKDDNLISKNLRSVFTDRLFDQNKIRWFENFDKEISKMISGKNQTFTFSSRSSIMGSNNQLIYIGIQIVAQLDETRSSDHQSEVKSFSCSIHDRTTEHFQEALVESEKRKGIELVNSLLPSSIIQRMNDGETDISFEVQQATVMFTSVSNWSELIKDMDANEVMNFLNGLYSEYDNAMKEFPHITKIKTIGHIYMVVAGLFNDSSLNSAENMLRYAQKLITISRNMADTLCIPLTIACGLNLGGPINCGILGKTRPVFDILGDPVNVASRMNSSSIPGFIQISAPTFEAIKYLDFQIKERGEIQVKGKGLMKTYFVIN